MSGGGFTGAILSRYAATSLYLYDVAPTFEDELELVWSSRWSLSKCAYLMLRYFGLAQSIFACAICITSMTPEFCFKYNWFCTAWLLIDAGLADLLSLLRVLALLRQKKPIVCFWLKVVYGLVYCIEFALLIYDLSTLAHEYNIGSYMDNLGCVTLDLSYEPPRTSMSIPDMTLAIAVGPVLLLNLTFFILVIRELLPYLKRDSPPLISAFVQVGTACFFMLAISTALVIFTPAVYYNSPGRELMGLYWFWALSPVAASRLFLNLRAAARRGSRQHASEEDESLTPESELWASPSQRTHVIRNPSPTGSIVVIGIPLDELSGREGRQEG